MFVEASGSKGKTITGTMNESSSSESHSDSETTSKLVSETWITTGTGSSSGKNKDHADFVSVHQFHN